MEVGTALMVALMICACRSASAGYENFTVGGEEGWTANPPVSYSKWAADKNFTLGDFLVFNFANPEYNVIFTYNETMYESCDYINSNGDFQEWGESKTTMSAAIPLVQTGPNYFFCGYNETELCKEGMKFSVNVTEGDGLPSSLAIPPPAPTNNTAPSQPTPSSGDFDGGNIGDDNGASCGPHVAHSFFLAILVLSVLFPYVVY